MRTKSKSSITTESKADRLPPVHPGEVLEEEFLIPLGLAPHRVAVDIGVPPPRINDIVLRRRGITADTALRLARYFGTSERFWLGLQMDYDLDRERDRIAKVLEAVPVFVAGGARAEVKVRGTQLIADRPRTAAKKK